jgi:diguanylate cyclase (GGDEF)-like protein
VAQDAPAPRPILDIRVRWKAGRVALVAAGLLALVAALRPLSPGFSPRARLAVCLALGLGVAATALLNSLKGRGRAEQLAFYAFLVLAVDAIGQIVAPLGWPAWPLLALLLAAAAVAERLSAALAMAALACFLTAADARSPAGISWRMAAATCGGYLALVVAVDRALLAEKRRLAASLAELARLRHDIGLLDEVDAVAGAPTSPAALIIRDASGSGRVARQMDRVEELNQALAKLMGVGRAAMGAHALLYFEADRAREVAYLRAWSGPPSVIPDCGLPLGSDPFAFVVERGQSFYATDFKRLLWSLPYYQGEVKIGTLLAIPVKAHGAVTGVLVADKLEIQSLTGAEPERLQDFAGLVSDAIYRERALLSREEVGAELKAVYEVSHRLAGLTEPAKLSRLLLRTARELVPLEAAAVVMTDEAETRYVIEEVHGWAREYQGRQVGLTERTWAAWVLNSAQAPYLLDDLAGQENRMPVLVLDEGATRAASLLAVPLRRDRTLGALILLGRRGAFDAAASRVLGVIAYQAAATLAVIRLKERHKHLAARDGLTQLYNRRAFDERLAKARAREERQGGRFAVLLLDIDHFKKLNDTFGHPAGDAALKHTARVLEGHLREGDEAARYGGEEFADILSGADAAGALPLAERVRSAIETSHLVFEGARLAVTVSVGVAAWPDVGRELAELLAAADRGLYAAKQAGRNRVVAGSGIPPAAART